MVRLYSSQPSSADSKRKTLRPKPQILIMEMHRSTAWHLARSEDGQFAVPPFPRVWLRPSGSVWEGEGAS